MAKTATKPAHTPGKTFVAKSKAHDGRRWVYSTNKAGKVIPVRPHSSNTVDKAKPAKPAATPKPDVRPFGAQTDTINRQADDEFAGQEAANQQGLGIAQKHANDLQTVFDRFKSQLAGQDDAMRTQQNAVVQQAQQQQAATIAGLGSAVGAGAQQVAQQAAPSGGTDYSADVAKIGAAGAAGANAVTQPAVTNMAAHAATDAGLMTQLGNLMEVERGKQAGAASQNVQSWQAKRVDVAGKKGKSKADAYLASLDVERKQAQQEFENNLAQSTLDSTNLKSLRDYRAKIKDINARTAGINATNATALDVAGVRADASVKGATIGAGATRDAAKTGAASRETVAQINARNRTNVANINAAAKKYAADKTGAGAKATASITTADGKVHNMSAADAKKWMEQRTKSIDAASALQRALGTEPGEGEAIKRVKAATGIKANVIAAMLGAAKNRPATAAERKALRTFFPGGIIPPGFIEGKVVN